MLVSCNVTSRRESPVSALREPSSVLLIPTKKLQIGWFLNEFVYKLNRRYFYEKLFDRLVIASITGL